MPSFKGGDKELVKFIVSHLKYPLAAKTANIQGKVIVKFVIRENGKADCFSISKNVDPLLDAEALRVVSSMPKWKPGKKDGKPVPVWFNLPVNFVLN
jgi:protein TonB